MYRKGSKGSKGSSSRGASKDVTQEKEPQIPGMVPQETHEGNVVQLPDHKVYQGWMKEDTHSKEACAEDEKPLGAASSEPGAGGYGEVALFTVNIILGIIGSQVTYLVMPDDVYKVWYEVVGMLSLLCLCFIMICVGYEFVIDKSKLRSYGVDTGVAMTAAGFPWLFVAAWFIWALPRPLPWKEALVAARFAAPTSAGVLFCMLEAAGLKETWLFRKARILAIFDDLDTILFMVPLKAILIGLKWELFVILAVVFGLLLFGYKKLHKYQLPKGWRWTMMYAVMITAITEILYYITNYHIAMEAIHIEVLLPAFILGVVIETEPEDEDHEPDHAAEAQDEKVKTYVSAIFMILVGFSMPPLFGDQEGEGDSMGADAFLGHVVAVSLLMILGKMFPVACYKQEATLRTRLALAIGMCPRGEVGAGVILISLDLGIKGEAVAVAIVCLALNMIMTGGFILTVKRLVTVWVPEQGIHKRNVSRRFSHLYGHPKTQGDNVTPFTDQSNDVQVPDMEEARHELGKKPKVLECEPHFDVTASHSTLASISEPIHVDDLIGA